MQGACVHSLVVDEKSNIAPEKLSYPLASNHTYTYSVLFLWKVFENSENLYYEKSLREFRASLLPIAIFDIWNVKKYGANEGSQQFQKKLKEKIISTQCISDRKCIIIPKRGKTVRNFLQSNWKFYVSVNFNLIDNLYVLSVLICLFLFLNYFYSCTIFRINNCKISWCACVYF